MGKGVGERCWGKGKLKERGSVLLTGARSLSSLPPCCVWKHTAFLKLPQTLLCFLWDFFCTRGKPKDAAEQTRKWVRRRGGKKKWRPNSPHKKRKEGKKSEWDTPLFGYSPSSICNSPLDHKKRERKRKRGPIRVNEETWGFSFFVWKRVGIWMNFPFSAPSPRPPRPGKRRQVGSGAGGG